MLRSSGEQNRNFVGTQDIAQYIEHLLILDKPHQFSVINPIGKTTISVYEFALKTASIYQKLTGIPCRIERPNIDNSANDNLNYTSVYILNYKKSNLEK